MAFTFDFDDFPPLLLYTGRIALERPKAKPFEKTPLKLISSPRLNQTLKPLPPSTPTGPFQPGTQVAPKFTVCLPGQKKKPSSRPPSSYADAIRCAPPPKRDINLFPLAPDFFPDLNTDQRSRLLVTCIEDLIQDFRKECSKKPRAARPKRRQPPSLQTKIVNYTWTIPSDPRYHS